MVDGEGTITIRREKRGKATEVALMISSENLKLLQHIKRELHSNGVKVKLGLLKRRAKKLMWDG